MKTYKIFRYENENIYYKKAFAFLERLIEGGYEAEEDRNRIVIDKHGDCHQCDTKLATMANLDRNKWVAMFAIMINDDKITLHRLY